MSVFQANSSPENRELEGILRGLERVLPDRADINRPGFRERYRDVLKRLAVESATVERLGLLLEGASYFVGGDEHIIVHSTKDDLERVYKFTHSDSFGCRSTFHPSDPDLMGKHFFAEVNIDLFFYLERWMYLNSISTYQTRFEGFLPPDDPRHMPRVCVSQPVLPPQSANNPNPTDQEIEEALVPHGYEKISDGAYLHRMTSILLTDAAPRNVRIVGGVPVPFDAIAEIAEQKVIDWAKSRRNSGR